MGILDTITQLAGQAGDAAQGDQAKVAGGFIQALTAHPEGIQGVLESLKANGMSDHIGSWMSGQDATATPSQVEQGLGSTGLIEKTAEHAGVSPSVVSSALAIILPMVIQHFAANNNAQTATTEQGGLGGGLAGILGKLVS
jgi:uncharacterized protein YidB (DUF937 family)